MASSCLSPRSQFSDLLITDCCDSVSEEEERCELSATYRIRQKIKMALINQQSKRLFSTVIHRHRPMGHGPGVLSIGFSVNHRRLLA